jgi:hypothetical protein
MNQPVPDVLVSLPIRQRSWIFCPCAAAGRFTVVVMYPAEVPVHAERPARGLLNVKSIVPLYPPAAKLPPAVMMSVNAPPLIEISSTPPSNVDSRL